MKRENKDSGRSVEPWINPYLQVWLLAAALGVGGYFVFRKGYKLAGVVMVLPLLAWLISSVFATREEQ